MTKINQEHQPVIGRVESGNKGMINFIKNLFKKNYKWVCYDCGDVVKSQTQPYCKPCSHINRNNMKMDKCCGGGCCD